MTDDGDYDCVDYGGINDKSIGNIEGKIEHETMQNPYSGGEIDEGPDTLKTIWNPLYGGVIWIYIYANP